MTADNECRCLNGEQPSRFSTRWAAGLVCLRRRISAGCCVALHVLEKIIGDGLSFFVPRLTSGPQVEGGSGVLPSVAKYMLLSQPLCTRSFLRRLRLEELCG